MKKFVDLCKEVAADGPPKPVFELHQAIAKDVHGGWDILVDDSPCVGRFQEIYRDANTAIWDARIRVRGAVVVWIRAQAMTKSPVVRFDLRATADSGAMHPVPSIRVNNGPVLNINPGIEIRGGFTDSEQRVAPLTLKGGRFLQGRGWPMQTGVVVFGSQGSNPNIMWESVDYEADPRPPAQFKPTEFVPEYGPQTGGDHAYMGVVFPHKAPADWRKLLAPLSCYGGVWWSLRSCPTLVGNLKKFVGHAYPEPHSINKGGIIWSDPRYPWRDSYLDDQHFVEPDRQHITVYYPLAVALRQHPSDMAFLMEAEIRARTLLRYIVEPGNGGTSGDVGDHREQGRELMVLCEFAMALFATRPDLSKELVQRAYKRFTLQMELAERNVEKQRHRWKLWGKDKKDRVSPQELGIHYWGLCKLREVTLHKCSDDVPSSDGLIKWISVQKAEIRRALLMWASKSDGELHIPYWVMPPSGVGGVPIFNGKGGVHFVWKALHDAILHDDPDHTLAPLVVQAGLTIDPRFKP